MASNDDVLNWSGLQVYDTALKDWVEDHAAQTGDTPIANGTTAIGTSGRWAMTDHVHPTDTTRAPTSHASSGTTYGKGTSSNYGHVKLSDSTSATTAAASEGTAATPKAVSDALQAAKDYTDQHSSTYSDFTGATSTTAGTHGLVPAPAAGNLYLVLGSNGSWTAIDVLLDEVFSSNGFLRRSGGSYTAGALTASDIPDLSATYALKTDISGAYKYKGSVATESALPSSGQTAGDVYNIEAASTYGPAGTNVAWTGSTWDALGGLFSLTYITTADIQGLFA